MYIWPHKHIISLSVFSQDDYKVVLDLAERFSRKKNASSKKFADLEGFLVTSIFFEPSTRTRNSFELAAKRLSADVQSFSPSSSSLTKGETILDTALTYSAMGADILIVRHASSHIPFEISKKLDLKNSKTSVLNAGDGLQSHPSQGLLDLFTLTKFFGESKTDPNVLKGKTILIIGDVLHSRVARSDIWALTAFGVNIILCGPSKLVPDKFENFIKNTQPYQQIDPIKNRGSISITRSLDDAIKNTDGIIVLRLQKERMAENLLSSIQSYSKDFCLTPEKLKLNKKNVPILHPGPINRGVEISSNVVDEYPNCLIESQVSNGVPVRMALLYLLSQSDKKITAI